MHKYFYVLAVLLVCFGCKTASIQQSAHNITTQQVTLGCIGEGSTNLLPTSFKMVAQPNYNNSIKIQSTAIAFNKPLYKTYVKAKEIQSTKKVEQVHDSIIPSLSFLELHIADNVSLITALNSSENEDLENYLSLNSTTDIVTDISIKLDEDIMKSIRVADAIFLEKVALKTYALQLYKDGNKTEVVHFNEGVVFAYKTSNFCWQENDRKRLTIVGLVDDYNACPNKTYRVAKRAKKKLNLYKL